MFYNNYHCPSIRCANPRQCFIFKNVYALLYPGCQRFYFSFARSERLRGGSVSYRSRQRKKTLWHPGKHFSWPQTTKVYHLPLCLSNLFIEKNIQFLKSVIVFWCRETCTFQMSTFHNNVSFAFVKNFNGVEIGEKRQRGFVNNNTQMRE